jgi:Flp pilus assembly protein TadB
MGATERGAPVVRDERAVARSVSDEIRRIVREELERASREEWNRRRRMARSSAGMVAALSALYLGIALLALALVYALAAVGTPWLAAALVGGSILVGATATARRAWPAFRGSVEDLSRFG